MTSIWKRLQSESPKAALLVGVLFTVALFAGVRPADQTVESRINISMWRVTGSEQLEPPVWDWYNESQEEIHVHKTGLPFLEIEQKFLTAAVGGVPPDVFEYFGSVATWSTRGALLPLDGFMERDGFDRDSIFPALWEEMTWAGQTYAIPTGTGCDAFYWNKDHFRAAGLDPERPPRTWEELEQYARRLTSYDESGNIGRAGYIPGYWSPFGGALFLNWPIQKGAEFLSEDGTKANLTSEAAVEALEWEARLFATLGREALIRKRASFGYGSQHGFMAGQLSMIVQKSSFVQEIEKFAPDMDYGVSLLPTPRDGSRGVIAGPSWVGIPAGAEDPEAAWEFIRFMTRANTQKQIAQFNADYDLAAFFPANIEAATGKDQMSLPHMDIFTRSMEFARSATVVPLAHGVFHREYANAWDQAMRGEMSAREALEEAERAVQSALDAQIEYNEFYSGLIREAASAQQKGEPG